MTAPKGSRTLRLGVAGLGTVGGGLLKLIERQDELRLPGRLVVTAVSARNKNRNRGVDISKFRWVDDPVELALADDVDVVVELVGGSDGPAKRTVEAALRSGKAVADHRAVGLIDMAMAIRQGRPHRASGDLALHVLEVLDALLRSARYVVAIALHTQGMTVDQAVEFFQKDGLQTRQVAELEARRGTQDPLYLVYTYGKLEILQLREEYKKRLGAAYSPRKFHDEFLRYGGAPLKLVRAALLDSH